MSLTAKTVRQAALYASFQGAGMLVSLISFPILTRWLTVAEYGSLAIVNATVMMLAAVAKSGLGTALLRQFPTVQKEPALQRGLISSTFWTAVGVWALVAGSYLAISRLFLQESLQLYAGLTLVAVVLVATATTRDLYQALLRARDHVLRSNVFALSLRVGVVAGGLICMLLSENRVLGFFMGSAAVELAGVAWMWGREATAGGLKWREAHLAQSRALLAFGLPLLTYEFASLVNDYLDRFLIAKFIGLEAVGQYSVGYNIASYAQQLTTAPMWMTVFPIYTRLWESEGREATQRFLSNILGGYTAVACGVVMIAIVAGDELIHVLAGEKYNAAATVLPMVCTAMMVYGTTHIIGAGFYLQRRTGLLAAITAASALCKGALNVVLIPKYGIQGAAWATIASFGAMTIAIAILGSRFIRVRWSFTRVLVHVGSAVATGALVSRINFDGPVLVLIAKVSAGFLVYGALLLALDRTLRDSLLTAMRRLPVAASSSSDA